MEKPTRNSNSIQSVLASAPKNALFVSNLKFLVFFSAALYLFGFSLAGVNVYGAIDFLIPFERLLCMFLSFAMWRFTFQSLKPLIKELYKNEKPKN